MPGRIVPELDGSAIPLPPEGGSPLALFWWTFLDPSEPDPPPRTCHGREELAWVVLCV